MNVKRALNAVYTLLTVSLLAGTAQAQQESREAIAEQEKAANAQPAVNSAPRALEGAGVVYPLFVGLDDATVPAYTIDPATDANSEAFDGVEVWGAAYDGDNHQVYFSAGIELWVWPADGGVPVLLGTVTDTTKANVVMEGLAYYDGTLFASKVSSTGEGEGIYEVNVTTLEATRVITYADDSQTTISGIDIDPITGTLYGTNDNSALRGLVQIDPDGTVTVVTPYVGDESDVDGLAVGGGRAYLITDDQTPPWFEVWDFAAAAYVDPVATPFTTTEVFAGGAWIDPEGFNPEPIARFEVQKDFNDDNPAGVEVTISCNTGLPLEQTTTISEGDGVTFVVTDFASGEMDCVISEEVPDGYDVEYFTNAGPSLIDCGFDEVVHGGFYLCEIENVLLDVDVEVTKVWIDENPQFNAQNVAGATWSCSNVAFPCEEGFINECDGGNLDFFGNPGEDSFSVFPDWEDGTTCSITEVDLLESGIEVDDSECQGLVVFPGAGASCTIFNTRLFEGIPTLSQYGLGLLALLMLGMGLVAFRRFA